MNYQDSYPGLFVNSNVLPIKPSPNFPPQQALNFRIHIPIFGKEKTSFRHQMPVVVFTDFYRLELDEGTRS